MFYLYHAVCTLLLSFLLLLFATVIDIKSSVLVLIGKNTRRLIDGFFVLLALCVRPFCSWAIKGVGFCFFSYRLPLSLSNLVMFFCSCSRCCSLLPGNTASLAVVGYVHTCCSCSISCSCLKFLVFYCRVVLIFFLVVLSSCCPCRVALVIVLVLVFFVGAAGRFTM